MKKLLLILLCFLPFSAISYAQINVSNFNKSIAILNDTTRNKKGINPEYQKFMKKNTKRIDAEVFQVLCTTDTLSICLIKVPDGFGYTYAALESVDDIVYDGKKIKREPCFFAGSFTYETQDKNYKTVPLYFTKDCYAYWVSVIINSLKEKVDALFPTIKDELPNLEYMEE